MMKISRSKWYSSYQYNLQIHRTKIQITQQWTVERRLELGELIGEPVQTFVEAVTLHSASGLDVPLK